MHKVDEAWLDETSSFHTDSDTTMREMNVDEIDGGIPENWVVKPPKSRQGAGT